MARPLVIDIESPTWRTLVEWAAERRADLASECCALSTPAARRDELAARIAELDNLLAEPSSAARGAVMANIPLHAGGNY